MMAQQTMKEMILAAVKANEQLMDSSVGSPVLEPVWDIFGEAVIALTGCALPVLATDDEDEHTLLLMLSNAISDSFSAFLSVRQGFFRPPAVVMRGVVENVAAVVAFHADREALKKFKQGRYDITKAITPAKAHFPELAHHYGVLTNTFTHETFLSVGRTLGKEKGIYYVPNLQGDKLGAQYLILLCSIGMIVHNIGQITEWCFIRYLKNPTLWEHIGGGEIKMKTTGGRKSVVTIGKLLEESLSALKE